MWGCEFRVEQITQVTLGGLPARSSGVLTAQSRCALVLAAVLAPSGGNILPWLTQWRGPFWVLQTSWLFQDCESDSRNLPIHCSKFCGSVRRNSSGRNLGMWGFVLHFLTWWGTAVLSSPESVLQRRHWQSRGGSYETRRWWIFQVQEGINGQEFSIW